MSNSILGYEHESFRQKRQFKSLGISKNSSCKLTGWQTSSPLLPPLNYPGVYVIYLDSIVSYIGSSRNVVNRIMQHGIRRRTDGIYITPWGSFSSVEIKYRLARKFCDWLVIEAWLIRRLQPRFNIDGVSIGLPRYNDGLTIY